MRSARTQSEDGSDGGRSDAHGSGWIPRRERRTAVTDSRGRDRSSERSRRDPRGYTTLGSVLLIAAGVLAVFVLLSLGLDHVVTRWEVALRGGPFVLDTRFLAVIGIGSLVAVGGILLGTITVWIRLAGRSRY